MISMISMMFMCSSVVSLFTQQLLMLPWSWEVFDLVAMLPSSFTSYFEPIGGDFQPAESCDLQSSLASLQAVSDSLTVPANSRRVLHLCNMTLPAAWMSKSSDAHRTVIYPALRSRKTLKCSFNLLNFCFLH